MDSTALPACFSHSGLDGLNCRVRKGGSTDPHVFAALVMFSLCAYRQAGHFSPRIVIPSERKRCAHLEDLPPT